MTLSLVPSLTKSTAPLVVESHPDEYTGFPFITLVEYKKQPMLVIVDNVTDTDIRVFSLDLCGPQKVGELEFIQVVQEWYNTNRTNYPLSVELSRLGLMPILSKIYRVLNVDYISRIIGPAPTYPVKGDGIIKRKKCRVVAPDSAVVQQLF